MYNIRSNINRYANRKLWVDYEDTLFDCDFFIDTDELV